jgi:hypothetical protein
MGDEAADRYCQLEAAAGRLGGGVISAAREARDLKSTMREPLKRRIRANIWGGYRVNGDPRKIALQIAETLCW